MPGQHDLRPGVDGRVKISREPVEVILVERAGRNQDPPGPDDFPQRGLRESERHARSWPVAGSGHGIKTMQLITHPPQLDLGP